MIFNPETLPRLLYIADVPVESSYHGSALVYRLLEEYPPNKLLIIETNLLVSQGQRRLSNVEYKQLRIGNQRWLNTRFQKYLRSFYLLTVKNKISQIPTLLGDFQPEAVLTVTHGYSWLIAAQWAEQNNLPLHLILHDDWIPIAPILEPVRKWLDRQFKNIYHQAKSRFCVSPFMVEEYQRRYGISGTVLYPSRAKNVVSATEPVIKINDKNKPFTVAYGGTINSRGYVRALQNLAEALEKVNGQLIIYGTLTKETANAQGLDRQNIVIGGLIPAHQFIERIRQEADVLFLPMSFEEKDKVNMQVSFPSKLTDYTATGLPLLIYGPSYCSSVRWATENQGVAEVVETEKQDLLTQAINKMINNSEYCSSLAIKSLKKGSEYFDYANTTKNFHQVLLNKFN
ncbi:glycosyltransferase [Geminocystis herdmanii]|uniref:glycosyltransferase n=1 Tax=Geminocystis herdmanii TaxID=669359 RepID=UPI0003471AC3|nr:glycosyltransferase [Geminocystis herdmanii]